MNNPPLIFLGLLIAFLASFGGLVVGPQMQIGRQVAVPDKLTGTPYPSARPGLAAQGKEVYRSLGCAECHTRQVRATYFSTDILRGWGNRFTVAQDYLNDYPVMLGSLRAGPDLTNIGARQTNENWHLLHLYNPRRVVPGSSMPRYPFLFNVKPGAQPTQESIERLATDDARHLVAYLLSLQATTPLLESPLPAAATNAPAATDTNAPAGAPTNTPAAPVK
jgi:cytochrome c oxidase cbb3-type subunit II